MWAAPSFVAFHRDHVMALDAFGAGAVHLIMPGLDPFVGNDREAVIP